MNAALPALSLCAGPPPWPWGCLNRRIRLLNHRGLAVASQCRASLASQPVPSPSRPNLAQIVDLLDFAFGPSETQPQLIE